MFSEAGLPSNWRRELLGLASSLQHRGPDDFGFYVAGSSKHEPLHTIETENEAPRLAFGHRRLSILDLSAAARQPMVRAGGNVLLTYNGEIYNFRDLRHELEGLGARFQTSSDTEVLIEAYLQWGIACVKKLRGIFAFAIADLRVGKLFLVRDHLGVKPLYMARVDQTVYFASELKAFCSLDRLARKIEPAAILEYLQFLWIASERTGLQNVQKLSPGTWLEFDLASGHQRSEVYWSPLQTSLLEPTQSSPEELVEQLRFDLGRIVGEQMVSDVPLGAFLSGGLDSGVVVALMQQSTKRISTYTIGYAQRDLAYDIIPDDLPYARTLSTRFNTDSTEILLTPDVASLLPTLVKTLDEPIGDPAAISSFLVCQAAKQQTTVLLSGIGADEIFGGYPRQRALMYGEAFRRMPAVMQRAIAVTARHLPGAGRGRLTVLGRSLHKFLGALQPDRLAQYIAMESYFPHAARSALVSADGELSNAEGVVLAEIERRARTIAEAVPSDPLRQAILWDLTTFLPSLNLAYTDRTSMAHAVEVRVPFLDIGLVEWSLRLRVRNLMHWQNSRLEGKWLLKQAAHRWLPSDVIWRRKAGFGAPVRAWLRNDLADIRRELLGPNGIQRRGWFNPAEIERLERDFMEGHRDYALQIWMLLTLELWSRAFVDSRPSD